MKALAQKYPRTARAVKEIAFYVAIFGGVFVLYAYVLPLIGVET